MKILIARTRELFACGNAVGDRRRRAARIDIELFSRGGLADPRRDRSRLAITRSIIALR